LVVDSVGLQPLSEVVHSDHEIPIPVVALQEGTCYVDEYPLELGPVARVRRAVVSNIFPFPQFNAV
jgi:hypothetical protein